MDAGICFPGKDFCLQEDCGGGKSGLRGKETREPGRKQKGNKLLNLEFETETCKNLQGKKKKKKV